MVTVKRFDFWLVSLNPTLGSEISKNRPCLVVSPDEANKFLNTVTIVPLTSTIKNYPTRVNCFFEENLVSWRLIRSGVSIKPDLLKNQGL